MASNISTLSKSNLGFSLIESNLTSYDYTDLNKTDEEKIHLEKRRRNQIYMLLDYVLSVVTYFDFFSHDTFAIVKRSKYLAQASKANRLTAELLLIPFLDSECDFSSVLKEHNLDEVEIKRLIMSTNNIPKRSFGQQKDYFFYKMFKKIGGSSFFKKSLISKNVKYSYDTCVIFEKAAENALTRFKTPVITPEILFITMMEEKNTKVSKIIKRFFIDETSWYLLRYKLIKQIHFQESGVRTDVIKNEQYFAYLLKINLSEFEFNRLIETKLLGIGVSAFRNKLITKMLTLDLFDLLEDDIHKSIKLTNRRTYST
jgi:hypothetical protein